jgi:hypothetical protein
MRKQLLISTAIGSAMLLAGLGGASAQNRPEHSGAAMQNESHGAAGSHSKSEHERTTGQAQHERSNNKAEKKSEPRHSQSK